MYRLTFNLVILIVSFYTEVVYFINKLGWRQYVGFVVFGEINSQLYLEAIILGFSRAILCLNV